MIDCRVRLNNREHTSKGESMMRLIRRAGPGVICLTILAAQPALAQTQEQLDWCNGLKGATPDQIIGGCTAVIQSGNQDTRNRSLVFNKRGSAHNNKGERKEALADFDQAIRLYPSDGGYFYNRGRTYFLMDQYGRAIADLDQAIRLNTNNAEALYVRGLAKQKIGNAGANADLVRAKQLNPQLGK